MSQLKIIYSNRINRMPVECTIHVWHTPSKHKEDHHQICPDCHRLTNHDQGSGRTNRFGQGGIDFDTEKKKSGHSCRPMKNRLAIL
jgi:hypothetical protein